MAKAIDIIRRAYMDINVIGSSEAPTASQASDALDSLNQLLDTWANESLMVYELVLENFNLVPGQSAYTMGPSGNFNTTRPVSVESAYVRWNGVDYPLSIVNTDQYDGIPLKTTPNQIPYVLYVDASYPLTTIKLFQTPNDSSAQIFMESRKPFTKFASLTGDVNMPPGYERALRWNLGLELCPENGVEAKPTLLRHANNSKKWVKRTNWEPLVQELDEALPTGRGYYDQNGNYV